MKRIRGNEERERLKHKKEENGKTNSETTTDIRI